MYFAAADVHISIASEELFTLFGVPITNATLNGAVGFVIMLAVFGYVGYMLRKKRYNKFVGLIQWVFESLLKTIHDIVPDAKLARKITPLAVSIFFFVLINYWLSILPGLDSITYNGVPVLRSLTADLNFTLGLALVTIVTVQVYAIKHLGVFGNAGRYLRNPLKDPIGAFEGLLELIGEFSRGAALALRLFGNAFAGEILLVVIAALTGYLASITLPFFMAFELFIGFIQAYVFFMLTLIFTALAVSHEHTTDDHSSPAHVPATNAQE